MINGVNGYLPIWGIWVHLNQEHLHWRYSTPAWVTLRPDTQAPSHQSLPWMNRHRDYCKNWAIYSGWFLLVPPFFF